MSDATQDIKKIVELMGFAEATFLNDGASGHVAIFVNEGEFFKKHLPHFVANLDHIAKLIAKKNDAAAIHIDVNNYRKERETLIVEIARGAARKAAATKGDVVLPAMNAYERRLIHAELASRPDVKTESIGEGKERYVVVKPI